VKGQLPLRLKLAGHTRLEDYVGDVSKALVELDGFVLLYGPAGSGKTHLLQGMTRGSDASFYLGDLEQLDPAIIEGLENAQLVCMDDIDSVLGNAAWETALFHLINACRDSRTKLLFSTSTPPAELKADLPDLASRLQGGYHLMTDTLDDAAKLEVIRRKAQRRGFDMNEDVCRFILSRAERDMHHLAKLVEQLDEETLRRQKKVTIPFVKQALGL